MSATVTEPSAPIAEPSRRRWLVLVVLCASVFVVVLDGTIVNVALPTIATELGASTSQLQWIVDSYVLVFAGLLMAAGSFGDRVGRKGVMQVGLVLFAVFSALAALSDSPGELIGWRAAMGVGAALMFPATLAILVNVFTVPRERAAAIAVWAATAGVAVALGPVTGGWLLEHFWWGSVLMINVPVIAVALVAIGLVVPTSRDTTIQRFDPIGTVAVDRRHRHARVGRDRRAGARLGLADEHRSRSRSPRSLLVGFVAWERHTNHPMLDVSVFTNMRFTAGSVAVTFAFFALFGFVFVVTQYFQFVRGYDALEAGLRTVPFAVFTASTAPIAAKLAERVGTKAVVTGGLLSMAVGFVIATTNDAGTPYSIIVLAMFFLGSGLGLVQAPATEAIMGSLPPAKAGVGSAVNDTARELGGTLGVAILGSVFSSVYASRLGDALAGSPVTPDALAVAEESVGAANQVAAAGGRDGRSAGGDLVSRAVDSAFVDGWHAGSWVAFGVVVLGALVAWRFLPARAAMAPALAEDHVADAELAVVGD